MGVVGTEQGSQDFLASLLLLTLFGWDASVMGVCDVYDALPSFIASAGSINYVVLVLDQHDAVLNLVQGKRVFSDIIWHLYYTIEMPS